MPNLSFFVTSYAVLLVSFGICVGFPSTANARAPNVAPGISGEPAAIARRGIAYSFRPVTWDRNGDRLKYSIGNKPWWMHFDDRTGTLRGKPSWLQLGKTYPGIVIRVSDGKSTTVLPPFSIAVRARSSNVTPRLSGSAPIRAEAGRQYYFKPKAFDANGDRLTYAIRGKPFWARFVPATGELYGTPPRGAAGKYKNIVISVTDGVSRSYLRPFAIVVDQKIRSVTLRWSAPTRNTDGSTLRNLAGFKVFYGQESGKYRKSLRVANPAINSIEIEGLSAGRWYFAVSSMNARGVHSKYSSEVSTVL